MPGKSLKTPPVSLVLGDEGPEEMSPVSSISSVDDSMLLTAGSYNDHILEDAVDHSQIPDAGGLYTQLPPFTENADTTQEDEVGDNSEETKFYQSKDISKWIDKSVKKLHVNQLRWDKTRQQGQIRSLNTDLVDHYRNQLKLRPPRRLIRILAKPNSGISPLRRIGVKHFIHFQMDITSPWADNIFQLHFSKCTKASVTNRKIPMCGQSCSTSRLRSSM